MRKRSSSIALFAALLVGAAGACSDDQGGSTVDLNGHPTAGTAASSGGSATGSSAAGGPGTSGATSGTAGTSGPSAPAEECPGLPIDVSGDTRVGSAVGESGGGAAGGAAASAAGAPPETPSGGAGSDESAAGGASGGATPEDDACNGVSVEAEAVPVDVFIMMDRSVSMGRTVSGSRKTRWEALHDAVQNFTEARGAAGIHAGIGFFSLSGSGNDGEDCDVSAYAEPRVPISPISSAGPDLVAAMDDVSPGGLTPTVPALRGAISYAQSWTKDNPGRATLVVLVTDGFPTQCENDPDQISQAAQEGYESPERIRTFVIGVGDVAKFNLENFARAGGSKHAYLTDAGDVTGSFVEALNNITNRSIACEYKLPPPPSGMKLDSSKVQVVYTPASGAAEEVPSISSSGACDRNPNGGWYYDDANQPSKITVCPCTCARFQAGRVDVRLGCKPRLGLR